MSFTRARHRSPSPSPMADLEGHRTPFHEATRHGSLAPSGSFSLSGSSPYRDSRVPAIGNSPARMMPAGATLPGSFDQGGHSSGGVMDVESADGASCDVLCWGCGLCLTLPSFSPNYKCGYCGALTLDDSRGNIAFNDRRRRACNCATCWRMQRMGAVVLVLLLYAAVISAGLWATWPTIHPSPKTLNPFFHSSASPPKRTFPPIFLLHLALIFVLSLNTVFNFLLAALRPAGPVPFLAFGVAADVPAGSLEGYSLCTRCNPPHPKPVRAHHCSTCGTCVMDMDHHCPFIGNCVGRANQRHFLLFLAFTITGCAYTLTLTLLTLSRILPPFHWTDRLPPILPHSPLPLLMSFIQAISATLYFNLGLLSLRAGVCLYLSSLVLAVGISLVILFVQQVQFVISGQGGYVDSLKAKQRMAGLGSPSIVEGRIVSGKSRGWCGSCCGPKAWSGLREVFGSGPMWQWWVPRFAAPQGSAAERTRLKDK